MASSLSSLLLLLSLLLTATTVTSIPDSDIQLMLSTLRSRDYNLFGNSIVISDIHQDLLQGPSFTLFAPTDGSLFSLEITASPSLYLSTLRYHIVPGKYSSSDLLALGPGSTLATLLPHHRLTLATGISPSSEVIKVDAVDVVVPGLYDSGGLAVHGLNGILDHRSKNRDSPDLEQISPESQSPIDLEPGILSPDHQAPISPENGDLSPADDYLVEDYPPEARAGSPESMYPLLKSSDEMASEYEEQGIGTWMAPANSALAEEIQCPDLAEGCREEQSELEKSDRLEVGSKAAVMMQGRIPASAPEYSPASDSTGNEL